MEASKSLPHASKLGLTQKYLCRNPDCKHREMILRKGEKKIPHFAHKVQNPECMEKYERETQEHLAMKKYIQELLQIPEKNIEVYGFEGVRPDLLWEYSGIKYAIEVQHSRIPNKEIQRRNQCYKNYHLIPLWIFHYEDRSGEFSKSFIKNSTKLDEFAVWIPPCIHQVYYLKLNPKPKLMESISIPRGRRDLELTSKEQLYEHIINPKKTAQEQILFPLKKTPIFQFLNNLLLSTQQSEKFSVVDIEEYPLIFTQSIPDLLWKSKNNKKYAFIIIYTYFEKPDLEEYMHANITPIVIWESIHYLKLIHYRDFGHFFHYNHPKLYAHIWVYKHRHKIELNNYILIESLVDNQLKMIKSMIRTQTRTDFQLLSCRDCTHFNKNLNCNISQFHLKQGKFKINHPIFELKEDGGFYFKKYYFSPITQKKTSSSIIIIPDDRLFQIIDKVNFQSPFPKPKFIHCDLFNSNCLPLNPNQSECKWCGSHHNIIKEPQFYLRRDFKMSAILTYPLFLCKRCFGYFSNYKKLCSFCKSHYHKEKSSICWDCNIARIDKENKEALERGAIERKKLEIENPPPKKRHHIPLNDVTEWTIIQEENGSITYKGDSNTLNENNSS
ncbi:competence protein CoiA [Promethearchaeum syntrophicum]|uniref:Competence protein CoiA n=1 Tax=Promethearchaeum syntrophicum TaxID=2594042 RepID=A0A5B9D8T7_9ARCH|nr:competence protein CoiA family protein [Candidatus Prometheoarchaeum syntrophicum]